MLDDFIHRVHESKKQHAKYSDTVVDCISYIQLHLLDHISLNALAKELGYVEYYLSRLFKKETGVTINSYITNQRIEYAKIRLRTSRIDVCQLSEMLQFVSHSYFTKIFREKTGMTPSEYRNCFTEDK